MTSRKCVIPECKKLRKTRGLCYTHYNKLRKRILLGKLSWRDAEDRGECLAPLPKKIFMLSPAARKW